MFDQNYSSVQRRNRELCDSMGGVVVWKTSVSHRFISSLSLPRHLMGFKPRRHVVVCGSDAERGCQDLAYECQSVSPLSESERGWKRRWYRTRLKLFPYNVGPVKISSLSRIRGWEFDALEAFARPSSRTYLIHELFFLMDIYLHAPTKAPILLQP